MAELLVMSCKCNSKLLFYLTSQNTLHDEQSHPFFSIECYIASLKSIILDMTEGQLLVFNLYKDDSILIIWAVLGFNTNYDMRFAVIIDFL